MTPPISTDLENLINELKAEELEADFESDSSFSELAGLTPEELQKFLEEKVGLSPDEGVQGTFTSIIVTPATHC